LRGKAANFEHRRNHKPKQFCAVNRSCQRRERHVSRDRSAATASSQLPPSASPRLHPAISLSAAQPYPRTLNTARRGFSNNVYSICGLRHCMDLMHLQGKCENNIWNIIQLQYTLGGNHPSFWVWNRGAGPPRRPAAFCITAARIPSAFRRCSDCPG
jgi:hypothetical protein